MDTFGGAPKPAAKAENGAGHTYRIAILDDGSQYGKVIDHKVRELQIESELLPLNTPANKIKEMGFKAIIILGGPGCGVCNAPEYDLNLYTEPANFRYLLWNTDDQQ